MTPHIRYIGTDRLLEQLRRAGQWLALLLVILILTACSMTRQVAPPVERLTLNAAEDVNPDGDGRPSPVMVRVLQLSSRTTLDNLDFDGAFDNAEVLVGDDLLAVKTLMLQAGESRLLRMPLERETSHMAVTAGFRQIEQARWKLVYPVNANWSGRHSVMLSDTRVRLGKPEPEPVDRGEDDEPVELMH
ncbi:MAG: type VI secretion system lipoprotein TssJ [Ectothiorhodospiraceae bacterium]|nr:type VI secretion system lipoprotein TssJ [Ectothiorhodospiraceae bacterium]